LVYRRPGAGVGRRPGAMSRRAILFPFLFSLILANRPVSRNSGGRKYEEGREVVQ